MKAWKAICFVSLCLVSMNALAQTSSAPMKPPMANAKDPSASKAEKEALLKLSTAYKSAKKSMSKAPKDKTKKVAFANAAAAYGTAVMNATTYTDRALKYKTALNLYREALKADPTNKEAQENKSMLESIYRSLGKPIPK